MELTLLITRGSRIGGCRSAGGAIGRALRLGDGVLPGSVQLEQLGTADQALCAERNHVRVRRAPASERCGPLLSATQVEGLEAGADEAAVHDADDHRRHLASRDGDHDFVQEAEPVGAPVHANEAARLSVPRQRHHVMIAEPAADRGSLLERRDRRRDVPLGGLSESTRAQKETVLDAVFAAFLEQALRTCEPSPGLRAVGGVVEKPEGHPERASRRAGRLPPL